MSVAPYKGKVRSSVDLEARKAAYQSMIGDQPAQDNEPPASQSEVKEDISEVSTPPTIRPGLLRFLSERKIHFPRRTTADIAPERLRSIVIREPPAEIQLLFSRDPDAAFALTEAVWILGKVHAIPIITRLVPEQLAEDVYCEMRNPALDLLGPLSCLFFQESDDSSGRLYLQDIRGSDRRESILLSIIKTKTTFPISLTQAKFIISVSAAVDKEIKSLISTEVGAATVDNSRRIVEISTQCSKIYDELVSQRSGRLATGPVIPPAVVEVKPEVNLSDYNRVLETYLRSSAVGAKTRGKILEGGKIPAVHRDYFWKMANRMLGSVKADNLVSLHCEQ